MEHSCLALPAIINTNNIIQNNHHMKQCVLKKNEDTSLSSYHVCLNLENKRYLDYLDILLFRIFMEKKPKLFFVWLPS